LRFRNKELEQEYEGELMQNNKIFYIYATSCAILMNLLAAVSLAFDETILWVSIIMAMNSLLHIIALVLIYHSSTHLIQLIFGLSIANILAYSNLLSIIGD
jgi:hypothetical protein